MYPLLLLSDIFAGDTTYYGIKAWRDALTRFAKDGKDARKTFSLTFVHPSFIAIP